jgi:hypothetical protein
LRSGEAGVITAGFAREPSSVSVRSKHFPEFGVTLNVFAGALTPDSVMQFVDSLEPTGWTRWVNYLDPTLDLSEMDIAHIPVIRRALAARLIALHGEAHLQSALVSANPVNELFLRFWPSYVGRYVDYPTDPVAFPALDAACDWLGLPDLARAALGEAALG